ncbi:MAG: flagellar motor switch protein FliN [Candidatus Cloacimonetes bacterium]|nr:flagellar motor switch protein FliN [Candidatus Cloacimonadota bacterium]
MSDMNKVNRLIKLFCSNTSGVLSTITNNTIKINLLTSEAFDFDKVQEEIELPGVMLTMNFSGDQNFQPLLLAPKKLVAVLADLMMLGDGDVDYFPDEHNEAVQEMFNQILGSLSSELSGEGITLSGTVTQVELTDMEIQKDFLEDNTMSRLSTEVIGQEFHLYLFLDSFAETSAENLFAATEDEDEAEPTVPSSGGAPSPQRSAAAPLSDGPPINVSRPQFSEIDEARSSVTGNSNMDLLYDIVLPVTVQLGSKEIKIKEILEMGQGSLIELDKTAGDYVDLIVNGKKFAIGEVMVADDNYAVRIVSLVSRKERIKSLGD